MSDLTEVPAQAAVHLISDNYGTHKTPALRTWLAKHPRFHMRRRTPVSGVLDGSAVSASTRSRVTRPSRLRGHGLSPQSADPARTGLPPPHARPAARGAVCPSSPVLTRRPNDRAGEVLHPSGQPSPPSTNLTGSHIRVGGRYSATGFEVGERCRFPRHSKEVS
ncbi:hypothetical protein GT350_29570 [Streptomyces sp. SID1034]|nr:hypothetical protein [Streptomyces sp. SID1034]